MYMVNTVEMQGMSMQQNPTSWTERVDPATKRPYYYNADTQETTWTKPAAMSGAGGKMAAEGAMAAGQSVWTEHVDPTTGRLYWHCAASGETTWEKPVGFLNAPPAQAASSRASGGGRGGGGQAIAMQQPTNPRTFGPQAESSVSEI